jgi:hypothetical protein
LDDDRSRARSMFELSTQMVDECRDVGLSAGVAVNR